jgi:hypothetical protein
MISRIRRSSTGMPAIQPPQQPNQALEVIEQAGSPAAYSAQKGEALVARAYAHLCW